MKILIKRSTDNVYTFRVEVILDEGDKAENIEFEVSKGIDIDTFPFDTLNGKAVYIFFPKMDKRKRKSQNKIRKADNYKKNSSTVITNEF